MKAYEACLSATSTADAPWYVVPADDKKNARLIISEIVLDVFNGLRMTFPKPTAKRLRELQVIRKDTCEVTEPRAAATHPAPLCSSYERNPGEAAEKKACLRGFTDEPVAESVQCGEPTNKSNKISDLQG
jgi:hypothetical protein